MMLPNFSFATRISYALVLCLALPGALLNGQQAPPPARLATEARPAPDPELLDARGYAALLEKHRGKPVLVNFWATWCPPCHKEYPLLNELAKTYGPKGLVVVAVSFNEDAELNLVRRFLARNAPVFANYRMKPGEHERFTDAVEKGWRGVIPATFFYDREGRPKGKLLGDRITREDFEREITKLLN
jgi:thiol-disulfide isomerase/thioredoxin